MYWPIGTATDMEWCESTRSLAIVALGVDVSSDPDFNRRRRAAIVFTWAGQARRLRSGFG